MHKTIAILTMAVTPLHALGNGPASDIDHLLPLSLDDLLDVRVAISTRSLQQMSKAPSVVSVITAEDIRATGATNLMDVLQSVPGLYVKRNLFAFRPLITLRGAPGTHVLLMVNGMPMRDLVWSNGIFWKGVPASAIERVEIVRGPGSALFGADASAGVINVITRTAAPIAQPQVGLRAGSYDSQAGWLQYGKEENGATIGLTGELSTTDGHRPYIRQDLNKDAGHVNYDWDAQDLRVSLAGGYWRFLADFMGHRDLGAGLNGAAELDPLNQSRDSQYSLALAYDNPHFAPGWGLNVDVRYRDLDYSSGNGFEPGPGQFPRPETVDVGERQSSLEIGGLYAGFAGHALRVGGGIARNDIYHVRLDNPPDPLYPIPESGRSNAFLYLQDAWTLDETWELTAGLRYDHFSDVGGALSPRLALVWRASGRLTGKLMAGEAFRPPSHQELHYKTSSNTPNPDLQPESSRTWELAFDYAASRNLRVGFNFYRFERFDLITAVLTPPATTKQFQNAGDVATRGIELEATWQATPRFWLGGNVTHREQDGWTLGEVNAPRDMAYLRLDWAFLPGWNWNLQANWFGDRPLDPGRDRSKDLRDELGPYHLVDTTLRYRPDRHWAFAVSARNLFDTPARDYSSTKLPDNLPLPGRNVYAELRYTF